MNSKWIKAKNKKESNKLPPLFFLLQSFDYLNFEGLMISIEKERCQILNFDQKKRSEPWSEKTVTIELSNHERGRKIHLLFLLVFYFHHRSSAISLLFDKDWRKEEDHCRIASHNSALPRAKVERSFQQSLRIWNLLTIAIKPSWAFSSAFAHKRILAKINHSLMHLARSCKAALNKMCHKRNSTNLDC